MNNRVTVETLTLSEISDLFRKSLGIAFPKSKSMIAHTLKKLKKLKISNHKWVYTYEEFKGAKLTFYCKKNHIYKAYCQCEHVTPHFTRNDFSYG